MSSRKCVLLVLSALVMMIMGAASLVYAANDGAGMNWQGLYVGIHSGYGWGDGDVRYDPKPTPEAFANLAPQTLSPDPNGMIAGGQLGYNWQKGHFVFGAETDFSWSRMSGSDVVQPFSQNNGTEWDGALTAHQDTEWFGTLRGRLGYTVMPKLLIYGTAGMAYGRVNCYANSNFIPEGTMEYPGSAHRTRVGWTAGAGAEYALTERWSIKGEYLYYDLGTVKINADPIRANPPFQVGYKFKASAQTFNVGLNYKF